VDLGEVAVIPAGQKAIGIDAHHLSRVFFSGLEGQPAEVGHDLGAVLISRASLVLVEHHVQPPVRVNLDTPVGPEFASMRWTGTSRRWQ
jgi:hypothetical protein